ncbi:MAG: type II toxin-antitoxin system RelE/ParE family toxin [Deltaproteobacteria bacterium]|jgi:mRNA interferase RelE/StbE|nr:type II toxin-antitoxin system RelE/ParE family toxin [Deltaproteobacteria bacterium]MCZ6546983.1 type II toxin-antitoxin system RelE/ParE family toxin [Deltaproteobacteria bacterium]MCZ6621308.1 type II toxin-antitoxin system RelE/ParE family toxin [Deltaproteobacteria bacterium]
MPAQVLKVSARVRALIRQLHPNLKRKVRSALTDILEDPACGKPLKKELEGYRSLRIGWYRIIYRPIGGGTEIVAIGPRRSIYEETAYQILRGRARD